MHVPAGVDVLIQQHTGGQTDSMRRLVQYWRVRTAVGLSQPQVCMSGSAAQGRPLRYSHCWQCLRWAGHSRIVPAITHKRWRPHVLAENDFRSPALDQLGQTTLCLTIWSYLASPP